MRVPLLPYHALILKNVKNDLVFCVPDSKIYHALILKNVKNDLVVCASDSKIVGDFSDLMKIVAYIIRRSIQQN